MKHPGKIGSHWTGKKWIHGPRHHQPNLYSVFRVKEIDNKTKLVLGKRKTTGKWEIQSEMHRRK